ncbi:MAG: DUF1343 domain-containing protein [Desulfobacteraceae bacterium]|nr:MAG: DUF1343 domain-containing protein [Desulfobacteraceae bacterium]
MTIVKTGLETLIENPLPEMKNKKLGLLCNPASISRDINHARDLLINAFPGQVKAMYSPQHGFFAEKQDNMIESDNMLDHKAGIPVFSLYGETRKPTKEMLDPIDILLVDLQDAGTRVYTFIYTLSYCMEAAKEFHKKVFILDRPNPIGGKIVEGNILNPEYASFVGRFPIPMRHGLTIGEIALLFNEFFNIHCDLSIIRMKNWKRDMIFQDTGLPWVPPSPNLPTPTSAMVYPGQVIWEGTNISEGRGTTQPFEIFGAPFLDLDTIGNAVPDDVLSGAVLRPVVFEPTSNKWSNRSCTGFQIHVTDPKTFRPYRLSLELLKAVVNHHRNEFQWKSPPYEYEFKKMPFDLISGDESIRKAIEKNQNLDRMETSWKKDIQAFLSLSQQYHLYS